MRRILASPASPAKHYVFSSASGIVAGSQLWRGMRQTEHISTPLYTLADLCGIVRLTQKR